MGELREFVTPLHRATKRDYLKRMNDDKVKCMLKAKEYAIEFWDGDRRYGYGGYSYRPGYWSQVAKNLVETYKLKSGSKVLDVGCGDGRIISELKDIPPEIIGIDSDNKAIEDGSKIINFFRL